MALLGRKKEERQELPSVLKTVLDMLALNTPETKIRSDLKGMGLEQDEIEQVLARAKKDYASFLESSLGGRVDQLWKEKRADISDMIGTEVGRQKKDVLLQLDLKLMEAKTYTDRKTADVLSQMETLRSDVYTARAEAKVNVDNMRAELEGLKLSGIEKRLLAMGVAFAGIFVILYPLATINILAELSRKTASEALAYAGLWIALLVFGILLVRAGISVYSARPKRKEHELFKP